MAKRTLFVLEAFIFASAAVGPVVVRAAAPGDPGRQAIAELEWKQVIRFYEPIAASAPRGSTQWTTATFCLAVAQQQFQPASNDTIGTAAKLYQAVIDESKEPRFVARSLMNLGRIAELQDYSADVVDLPMARNYYEQVMQKYPNDPIASEAALREGAALVMEYDAPAFEKSRAGAAFLEKWVANHPSDPLASLMWQTAGDAYFMPLDDWKNALRCYEKVDQLGWTDQGNQGAWYWRCAKMAEALKDRATAIKYYTKIINETPNSGQGYASVLALRKLDAPVPANPLFDDPMPTTQPVVQAPSKESK